MSFNRHAYCDRCEAVIWVADEDELLEEGWLTVTYGPASEEVLDFCCLDCLARWGGSPEARQLLEEAAASREEDE